MSSPIARMPAGSADWTDVDLGAPANGGSQLQSAPDPKLSEKRSLPLVSTASPCTPWAIGTLPRIVTWSAAAGTGKDNNKKTASHSNFIEEPLHGAPYSPPHISSGRR